MYYLGKVLLAGAALAAYEHGEVGGGYGDGSLQRPVQRRIVADDVLFVLKSL